MDVSIFDVAGPVMVGPSSSHTAGAAKLGRIALLIAGKPFLHVSFGLHGSFAKTFRGHGTDKALLAGVLGLREDDENIKNSFALAAERKLTFEFYETVLKNMHENSVKFTFYFTDGSICEVVGCSIGGGQIEIRQIDGFDTFFTAQAPTLIITQNDQKGVVSDISRVLLENDINIAVMRLSRKSKGDVAFCTIETDSPIPPKAVKDIEAKENILRVRAVNIDG